MEEATARPSENGPGVAPEVSAGGDARPKAFLVTADPPTPNGDLHVGHLSGPYFASDVLTRALRQRGHRVAYFTNLDPHQSYVDSAARRSGREPQEILARFGPRIREVLAADAIDLDFIGVADPRQGARVDAFFRRLWEGGKLLAKEVEIPYCSGCKQHLFEAYVEGACPNCGADAYGNSCETCRRPSSTGDMGRPRCRLCGMSATERVSYRGLFLPLERYRSELLELVESRRDRWRETLYCLVREPLGDPLPDIPLSFVSDYGLPVTIPGFEGQIYNVRLEILPALVHAFERSQEDGAVEAPWHWRTEPDLQVIAFHGTENGYQYAISFNALLIAAGQLAREAADGATEALAWPPPVTNITNEFYLLEGEKFSTTRKHAVWGLEALAAASSDALRFYLALTNPETEETSFSWPELTAAIRERLSEPWTTLHRQVAQDLEAGARTESREEPSPEPSPEALEAVAAFAAEMDEAFSVEDFSLRRGAEALARWLAQWSTPEAASAAAADRRLAVEVLAWYAFPLLPELCGRLQRILGVTEAPSLEGPQRGTASREISPSLWSEELLVPIPGPVESSKDSNRETEA